MRDVIGITDPSKTLYSLRHNFKDACRMAHLPEDVHDQLTGHSSSSVGRTYGASLFPLEPLFAAVKKIGFKGLSPRHWHKV
jgi:hypothetical protein